MANKLALYLDNVRGITALFLIQLKKPELFWDWICYLREAVVFTACKLMSLIRRHDFFKQQFICQVVPNCRSLKAVAKIFQLGDVAAPVRSHMNGLQPFERTIQRTTETMPLAPKQ